MVLNVHRNRKAYWGRGEGGRKGEGVEVWGEGAIYLERERETYRYTLTTRMTPALRSAAMRAILMFH